MARSSSPLPIRHSNALPRTPSLARNTITIDDADEITDTIPCSPSAFFQTWTYTNAKLLSCKQHCGSSCIIALPAT
ncbi:hypothetical protein LB505_003698 [Fusarium chuoi]|nr:hypothetical protein LB505_003698 [Fusarium chuoi]